MLNTDTTKQTSSVQPKPGQAIDSFVNDLIRLNDIVIFSKTTCPFCAKVKELFKSLNHEYVSVELDAIGKLNLISFKFELNDSNLNYVCRRRFSDSRLFI